MSFARVLYPPQPPTSNMLTAEERTQLVRSTKKLGKLLGSTPHLIDESRTLDPVHVSFSVRQSVEKPHLEIIDTRRSDDIPRRSPSISSNSTISNESTDGRSSLSSTTSMSSYAESVNSADSWRMRKPTRKPPPLLRLTSGTPMQGPPSAIASVKPSLETIPASPPFEATAGEEQPHHSSTTISFATFGAPRPPSFEIPSEATLRWAKMERLRKKLGDGVPASLVFDDVESITLDLTSTDAQSAPSGSRSMRHSIDVASIRATSPAPGSSFSLERPLFAIVEGPDDHVVGCFGGSKKEKRAILKGYGKRR